MITLKVLLILAVAPYAAWALAILLCLAALAFGPDDREHR